MASNDNSEVANEDTKICSNCTRYVAVANFLIHTLHCTKNIQLCSLCNEPFPTKEIDQHMMDYHQIQACEKCNEVMERWQLEKHKDLCTRRSSTCQYCMISLPFNSLSEHEEYCGSRTLACVSCKKFIMIKHEKQHFEICKKEQLKKYGERTRMISADKEMDISRKNIFPNSNDSTINKYGIFADFKDSVVYGEKQPFNVVPKVTNVTKGLREGRKGLNEKEMKALIEKTKDVFVVCYICSQSFLKSEVEEHTYNCTGSKDSVNSGHCETDISSRQCYNNQGSYNNNSEPSCYADRNNTERMQKRNFFTEPLEPTYEECPVCSSKFMSHELNMHITLCSEKKTTCSLCHSEIYLLDKDEHMKKCCDNHNTSKKETNYSSAFKETIRRKLYNGEQQLRESADENCSSEFQYDMSTDIHSSSLEENKEQCPVCLSQIPLLRFEYHVKYCLDKKTVCHFCCQTIYVLEEEEHLRKCDKIKNSLTKGNPNYNSDMNRQSSFSDAVRSSFNSAVGTVWNKLSHNDFLEEISPNTESLISKPSPKKCSLCSESVHESDYNHLENCLKKSFKCRFCDTIMLPPRFKQHIDEDCQEFKKTRWHPAQGSGKRKKKAKQTNYYDYFTKNKKLNAVQSVKEVEIIMLPCEFCEVLIPDNEIILHESGCRPDLVSFAKKVSKEDLATYEDNLGATASGSSQKFKSDCTSPRENLNPDGFTTAPGRHSNRTSPCVKKSPDSEVSNLYKDNVKRTTADPIKEKLQKWTLNSNWDTSPGEYLSSNVSSAAEFNPQFNEGDIFTNSYSSKDNQYINSLREEIPKASDEIKTNSNTHRDKYIPEHLQNCGSNDKEIEDVDKYLSFLNLDSDEESNNTRASNINSLPNVTSNPLASIAGNWDYRFHQGVAEGTESNNFNDQRHWAPIEKDQHSSDEHNYQFGDMASIWSNSNQVTENSDSYDKTVKEYRNRR